MRCWDLARNENALCELLLQRFPHVFSPREQQLIQEGLTDELLETVRRRDPLLALRLWRTLLDAAQAHLDNPEAAEVLLDESVEPYMWDDNFLPCGFGAAGSRPKLCLPAVPVERMDRSRSGGPAGHLHPLGRSQTLGAAGSAAAPKSSYPERLMPHTRPSKVLRCVPGKNQL